MAFVVEDGTGLSTATSYTSLAFANGYHADRANAAWELQGDPQKQAALIRATDWLDRNIAWRGLRLNETQALLWPRVDVFDLEYNEVPSDSVPVEVQKATAELALLSITQDLEPSAGGTQTVTQKSAGPFSISFAGAASAPVFHKAMSLIGRLRSGDQLLRA